jgi:ubiquinone/menaquinone biosynthesis C-methylase UbiE
LAISKTGIRKMPDPYANIADIDAEIQAALVEVLEVRAAEPRQQEMLETYLRWIDFPKRARVLDVGCGTGATTRLLARWPRVQEIVGVDPSPVFLAKARERAAEHAHVRFEEGDVRALAFDDGSFDVAIAHTCLSHVPGAEQAFAELFRVVRPGGSLAVFDADYATTTAATGEFDPLQCCIDAAMAALVHDRWLARQLPAMAVSAGFEIERFDGHAYVQTLEPRYLPTLVDRGADALVAARRIGAGLAEGLKAEARQRVDAHGFYGSITFASLIARRFG